MLYKDCPIGGLAGFGPATMLMGAEGEIPVEWLATGDRLVTRDMGLQPVRWIGRYRVRAEDMVADPRLIPMEMTEGALGAQSPAFPTWFTPFQRVLLSGPRVELHLGEPEALARISDLASRTVRAGGQVETHYTFVLLERHDMVQANGIWAETTLLDLAALRAIGGELPADILGSGRIKAGHARTARPYLSDWETCAILGGDAALMPRLVQRAA